MVRKLNKLSARTAATIAEPGRHSDGGGLYLFISTDRASTRKRWIFRFTRQGKTKEMGSGSASTVSLAQARQIAANARDELAKGRDPIEVRESAKMAEKGKKTFGKVADEFLASKAPEWRNDKHRAQWRMTLTEYAAPLRDRPVDEIDTARQGICATK